MSSLPEIVCVLQHGGIGDLIHLTPMLSAIRQIKPESRLYLCTRGDRCRILEGWPLLNTIVTTDPYEAFADLGFPITWLLISPIGAIVPPQLVNMSQHILQQQMSPGWTRHEVEVHMDFAREMGYRGPTPSSVVVIFDSNKSAAEELMRKHKLKSKKFIAINASYRRDKPWPLKHWGTEKYRQLVRWLKEELRLTPVLVGASVDWENGQKITEDNRFGLNLCGFSQDIKDTAALLTHATLLIGNDGGLAHVASAIETPTLTIFTFTNPIMNTPRAGEIVMVPCSQRLYCQHDLYERCAGQGCLDVPFDMVQKAVLSALHRDTEAL